MKILDRCFIRITYDEALAALKGCRGRDSTRSTFSRRDELFLCEQFGNVPVFVTHYPSNQKPFYMRLTDDRSKVRFHIFLLHLLWPTSGL